MAITLRADKGSALTYSELDNNFVSFFYSASISTNQEFLNLFYTGSSGLGLSQTSIQIPLNPYTGSNPPVAGNATTVQYNNAGSFGGDDDFRWIAGSNTLVVGGTTTAVSADEGIVLDHSSLRVKRTSVVSEPDITLHYDDSSNEYSSSLKVNGAKGRLAFEVHNTTPTTGELDSGMTFTVNRWSSSTPAFAIAGTGKIVSRGASTTYGDNNFSGSLTIDGNVGNINRMFRIRSVDSSATQIPFTNAAVMNSIGDSRAVVLDGPDRGHVIVGLQSSGNQAQSQTFSILSGPPTSSNYNATYNNLVAMFRANGQVGIGTTEVISSGYKLIVAGGITGSDMIHASGVIKAGSHLSGSGDLHVVGGSTLNGTVKMNTVANASSATNYNFLVRESSGNIAKQVNAAPIPVGGIIMWSGAVQSLPTGWALCNGQTQNSVTTPDLRNKFILGSNNTTGTPTTTLEGGGAAATGGAVNHNHGGSTNATTLSANQIPAHTHTYKDSYYIEHNDPGLGSAGAIDGVDNVGPTNYKGSGDSDSDNQYVYYRDGVTNANTTSASSHDHNITANNHIPPYYSLAYIMYTG